MTSACEEIYSSIVFIQQKPVCNAGLDQAISGNKTILSGNTYKESNGTWQILSGSGGSITDIHNNNSGFQGQPGSLNTLSWTLENSCGTNTDTVAIEFVNDQYSTNIIIVDTTDILLSDSAQLDTGIYRIRFSEKITGVNDSTILVSMIGNGFLRKVSSYIKEDDSTFTFYTVQGMLDDICNKGVFNFGGNLGQSSKGGQGIITLHYLNRLPTRKELITDNKFKKELYVFKRPQYIISRNKELKSANATADNNLVISSSLNETLSYGWEDNQHNELLAELEVKGSYSFIPNFVWDEKIDNNSSKFYGFDNAVFETSLNLKFSPTIKGTIYAIPEKEFTLWNLRKVDLYFPFGIPVVVITDIAFVASVGIEGSGSATFIFNNNKRTQFSAGVLYSEAGISTTYKNISKSESSSTSVTVQGSLKPQIEIGPKAKFMLYGVAGPYFKLPLTIFGELCGSYPLSKDLLWQAKIGVKLEAEIGAEISLTKKLTKKFSGTVPIWEARALTLPYQIQLLSGDNQKSKPGEKLAQPIKIKVISDWGLGVPFVPVWFEVIKNNGVLVRTEVVTNINGIAENNLTLGNNGEENRVKVYVWNCDMEDLKGSPIYLSAFGYDGGNINPCQNSSLGITLKQNSDNTVQPYGILGTKPYSYSTDGTSFSTNAPRLSFQAASGLVFYVKDANGCQQSKKYIVYDPCLNTNLSVKVTALGYDATLIGSGGNPPYQFSIGSSKNYSLQSNYPNLSPGSYIAYVKDNSGCVKSFGFAIGASNNQNSIAIDYDGNTYKTVQIGSHIWMAENLKTTKYNEGTAIPNITDATAWSNLTTPSYCWYNNDEPTYKNTYGALYNWYAVDTRKLCPTGWHVPTDAEWTTLTTYLGGESVAGGKLKEIGTTHWANPNTGATNETGFTAIPDGHRYYDGSFVQIGVYGYWWSSTKSYSNSVWFRYLYYSASYIGRHSDGNKGSGFSVRCVKDSAASIILPIIKTFPPIAISDSMAIVKGNISLSGSASIVESGFYWSTNPQPKLNNHKITVGSGIGDLNATISGLLPDSTYYLRCYAIMPTGTVYGNEISFTTTSAGKGMVMDIEGNIYKTVKIGTQTWMAENLKTTKYNDGNIIPNVTDNTAWVALSTPGYCWYNDSIKYKNIYGALYNWFTVNKGNLCPIDWHVPSEGEWTTLTDTLGGISTAGGKMKETGFVHWLIPNDGATNISGFTGLPGGFRWFNNGAFLQLGTTGTWWASTVDNNHGESSRMRPLYYDNITVGSYAGDYAAYRYGFSVRCLKN